MPQGESSCKSLLPVTAPAAPTPYPHPYSGMPCSGGFWKARESTSPLSSAATWLPADHSLLKQTNSGGSGGSSSTAALHGAKVSSTLLNVQEISPALGQDSGGRERPSPSRNAPPAEWMCARPAVGSEADESHRRLISVPTPDPRPVICPGGMARRSTPQRKLPSRLACPFSPSLCHKGAGTSKEQLPTTTTSSSSNGGEQAARRWGAEAALSGVSARGALAPDRPRSHPAFPPPRRSVGAGADGQTPSAANAPRWGERAFIPNSGQVSKLV